MFFKILLGALITSFTYYCNAVTTLYLFKSSSRVGDNDQLQGAANAIKKNFSQHNISVKVVETFESDIVINKNSITLFSNNDGVQKWKNVQKQQQDNVFSVFLTHQWWDNLLQTFNEPEKFNLIVAPKYTITPEIENSATQNNVQIFGINGVCSSLQKNDLIQAYKSSNIPKNKNYILVLLAGDVEDSNGNWHLFTEKDAIQLANTIIKRYIKTKQDILVINGPRTGKIDPITRKETSAHHGKNIDLVSKAFLAKLASVVPHNKFQFYNFQYGTPSILPSAMGAILMNKGSYFYIPGESISTGSQAIGLLPTDSIIFYVHNAMLNTHREYVTQELKSGCATVINESGNIEMPSKATQATDCLINQCDIVAEQVYKLFKKKDQ